MSAVKAFIVPRLKFCDASLPETFLQWLSASDKTICASQPTSAAATVLLAVERDKSIAALTDSDQQRQRAEGAHSNAETNLALARAAVDEMYTRVAIGERSSADLIELSAQVEMLLSQLPQATEAADSIGDQFDGRGRPIFWPSVNDRRTQNAAQASRSGCARRAQSLTSGHIAQFPAHDRSRHHDWRDWSNYVPALLRSRVHRLSAVRFAD